MEPTTGSSSGKRARSPPPPFVAAVASNKGKKHTLEDVPIVCPSLDGSDGLLSLYAILDGHGGSECAEWCADRLPAILATRLATTDTSPAIKEAIKAAGGVWANNLCACAELTAKHTVSFANPA